ncbi:hypothetical protein [Treponema sp. UBA6852]|uniref:hypothetical protein n=1 Tax=Treponema sp. UBA6852 TaxID=1947744 RepID=UPI0025F84A8E|nr:hypothetical protein [Treponema sp. UBA6852]
MDLKNKMISASKNFQTSVNIAFDFDNPEKLAGFIPTSESVKFIDEEILSALGGNKTEFSKRKAEILIGPYGKGKSYIVLEMLSLLYNNPDLKDSFESLAQKVRAKNPDVAENILQYVKSGRRLLPIVINGNSQSLSQSFLYALHLTLKRREFENLMPETHFESAVKMIEKWEDEYPETLEKFNRLASVKAAEFKRNLLNYDSASFEEFEKLYPSLTSGSEFNPFSGFDVVDIYEQVCKKLCESGKYDGIFVVYDEFGKYLESSIAHATVKDTKLLQDFAERSDRSGKNGKEQLHLLLICHKEIENYIDILPKQKVDGWKGVSERFRHIHLYNNYSEVYSLISAAILKNASEWKSFCVQNKAQFENLKNVWLGSGFRLFSNLEDDFKDTVLYGCYPLHPVTSYILPRLSEKVAQNERTLFTFLSGNDKNGFSSLIEKLEESGKTEADGKEFLQGGKIILFTPDVLFDYFENQLQNEPYTSEIKKYYLVASSALRQLEKNSLEAKIVKTIALIYSLNQFERLSPDLNLLFALYDDSDYSREEIRGAVKNLSEKFGAVYLNVHNNYLQLKTNSGADIPALISACVEKRRRTVRIVDILNEFNTQKFIYPTSYNIEKKMTRYFSFSFVSLSDFFERNDWKTYAQSFRSDGCVFALFDENKNISEDEDSARKKAEKRAVEFSSESKNLVFIVSKLNEDFSEKLRRFEAVSYLKNQLAADSDSVLFDEYEIIFQDLYEVVKQIVYSYIQPERKLARYFSGGEEKKLYRKSDLTNLVSAICAAIFYRTPVINNEMLNKNCLTGAATKSRAKLVDAMLNSPSLDLGLSGSGQEVSFMRSVLILPGILKKADKDSLEKKIFNLEPDSDNAKNDGNFKNLFAVIKEFFARAEENEVSFSSLFEILVKAENGFGLRRGVIPVYLAAMLSSRIKNAVLKKGGIEVPVNAQTLAEIAETPEAFTVRVQKWNDEKENYIHSLENFFADFVIEDEKNTNGYSYLINAMLRWYRSLAKYTKQMKKVYCGFEDSLAETKFAAVRKEYSDFLSILKQGGFGANEILFEKIPCAFRKNSPGRELSYSVKEAKKFFDCALETLENALIEQTKKIFEKSNSETQNGKSLKNLLADFCKKLAGGVENQIFENGAHSLFKIYKSAGNDEKQIVFEMSKVLTGLSIDDWNDETASVFFERLDELNKTLLEFKNNSVAKKNEPVLRQNQWPASNAEKMSASSIDGVSVSTFGESNAAENYEIRFAQSGAENAKSKSFRKVECSVRAKSLEEEIWRTIEEMGQSVTDAEKRQVLVSLLEKLC